MNVEVFAIFRSISWEHYFASHGLLDSLKTIFMITVGETTPCKPGRSSKFDFSHSTYKAAFTCCFQNWILIIHVMFCKRSSVFGDFETHHAMHALPKAVQVLAVPHSPSFSCSTRVIDPTWAHAVMRSLKHSSVYFDSLWIYFQTFGNFNNQRICAFKYT